MKKLEMRRALFFRSGLRNICTGRHTEEFVDRPISGHVKTFGVTSQPNHGWNGIHYSLELKGAPFGLLVCLFKLQFHSFTFRDVGSGPKPFEDI
ncbi:MAG: hypothetical protein ACP5SH_28020, partial [Syntrophobacteraceae bacterium]